MPVITANLEVTSANTLTTVYTATSDINVNIYVLNTSANTGNIRLAVSSSTPAIKDYLFYDFPIKTKGTFVLEDVYINSGDKIWIYAPLNFIVRVGGSTDPSSAASSAPTIASATTIAPTTKIAFVSGTAAIATITVPSNLGSFGNQITLIPTGAFTTTTAGNIAIASTAVVSKALIMTYDATTIKWYPSY